MNNDLLPKYEDDEVLIVFEVAGEDDDPESNILSPVYNIGVSTWPSNEWIKTHTDNFIEEFVKPNGLYSEDTIIWRKRLFTKNELDTLGKKYYGDRLVTGIVIDAIRIKEHYATDYTGTNKIWGNY